MRLHWHRQDLRLADNPALMGRGVEESAAETPVVGLFVFDPGVLAHAASPRLSFMLDALDSLRANYRERGGELLLARGDPETVVPDVASELDADLVTWAADYSGLARERDAAVRQALSEAGVDRHAQHQAVHHRPGTITTNAGDPYKVFTYFSKKWHDRPKEPSADLPGEANLATVNGQFDGTEARESLLTGVPTLADLGFDDPEAEIPTASTERARERLREFCESDIYRYGERRDYPSDRCTSRLSAYLKYGLIGVREVYETTERARERAPDEDAEESVHEYQDQLAWREFYTQVLWDRPDVVTSNYKSYENDIEWDNDPEAVQAWKNGETGYPIVDAGMRQLRAEAFMHNRVRMIVASFLTKDLLVDWRVGYDWFREKLVDHDTANDNGGWQWAASTGTDAQPYFRIFNPMSQGERYDSDAEYIRKYVPELDGVPAETIHAWHELDAGTREMHAPEYPAPIVDHSERREQALAMFEQARGDD
jgi:deoxyribodipyrimidine photo-lyase